MNRNEVTGSKNFNAEDLVNGPLNLVIEDCTMEQFKQQDGYQADKLVISFRGHHKRLVCGKNKANALFDLLGDDTDDWVGEKIQLFRGKTNYQGKQVACVDVRRAPVKPANKPKPAPIEESTDDSDTGDDAGSDDDTPY